MDKADIKTFQDYIANFWLFLQLDQTSLVTQLESEKNKTNISAFACNFDIRFVILQKNKNNEVTVEIEWTQ